PFVPPIPGTDKDGVFVYRTIDDLEKIEAYASKAKSATVLGGGLLGLEAAKALIDLKIDETHVVEFAPKLMPRQIDERASKILVSQLEGLGLQIFLNKETILVEGDNSIQSIKFRDGGRLETDMLVISAGIQPRDALANDCGLQIGSRGGIVVNEYMQTADRKVTGLNSSQVYKVYVVISW